MFEIGRKYSGDMNGEVFTVVNIKKAERNLDNLIVFQSEKTGNKYELYETHASKLLFTRL